MMLDRARRVKSHTSGLAGDRVFAQSCRCLRIQIGVASEGHIALLNIMEIFVIVIKSSILDSSWQRVEQVPESRDLWLLCSDPN